jgi:hypothetical protein
MKKEVLHLISSIIFPILSSFFYLTIENSLSFLVMIFFFLPFILFNAYRVKKFNYRIFYSTYLIILTIQSGMLISIYMNKALFLNLIDYIFFIGMIVGLISFVHYYIQLYRKADNTRIITW